MRRYIRRRLPSGSKGGCFSTRGCARFPQNLDLDLAAAIRHLARDVADPDDVADVIALAAGGQAADHLAIDQDRLVAHRIDRPILKREDREAALWRLGKNAFGRGAADEVALS